MLEGRLIGPWVAELRSTCKDAAADLHGREPIVEMNDLSAISQEGENVLLEVAKRRNQISLPRRIHQTHFEATRPESTQMFRGKGEIIE
jgi:hypothetical protein